MAVFCSDDGWCLVLRAAESFGAPDLPAGFEFNVEVELVVAALGVPVALVVLAGGDVAVVVVEVPDVAVVVAGADAGLVLAGGEVAVEPLSAAAALARAPVEVATATPAPMAAR